MNTVIALFFSLVASPAHPQDQEQWERHRALAESEYEIILLNIKRQQFNQVLPVARKLFAHPVPEKEEHRVVQSAKNICESLSAHRKYQLAVEVMDVAVDGVKRNRSKAALVREKAYLFKRMGNDEEAMKHFQEALRLEDSDNQ